MTKILEREATGSTLERPAEIEQPPVEIPPRPELPAPRRPYVRWLGWMLVVAVIAVAGILVAIQSDDVVLDDGSFEANELARMMRLTPSAVETSFAARTFADDAQESHLRPWMTVPFEASFAAATFANDPQLSHLRPWMTGVVAPSISLMGNIEKALSFEASFPGLAQTIERDMFISMLKANIEKTLSFEASFPTIDTSFEANELARMLTLVPTIDTSFEANELARLLLLAPEVSDGSFEANELARMLGLAPETDISFEANELVRMLELEPEG